MKMYIPEIGDEIVLSKKWNFVLYPEKRNIKLGTFLGHYDPDFNYNPKYGNCVGCWMLNGEPKGNWDDIYDSGHDEKGDWYMNFKFNYNVSLPKGTILKVDRIYIRKGAKEFSSISFIVQSEKYKKARFWAKLNDVNTLGFNLNSM